MLTREPMGAELPRQDTRNHPQDFSFCGLRSGCGSTSSGLGVLEDAFTTPCPIAHGDGRPNCCRLGRDPRAFPGRECSPRGSRIARRVRFLVLFLPSAPPPPYAVPPTAAVQARQHGAQEGLPGASTPSPPPCFRLPVSLVLSHLSPQPWPRWSSAHTLLSLSSRARSAVSPPPAVLGPGSLPSN